MACELPCELPWRADCRRPNAILNRRLLAACPPAALQALKRGLTRTSSSFQTSPLLELDGWGPSNRPLAAWALAPSPSRSSLGLDLPAHQNNLRLPLAEVDRGAETVPRLVEVGGLRAPLDRPSLRSLLIADLSTPRLPFRAYPVAAWRKRCVT